MNRRFDEEKLTRYLDGDLSPEEMELFGIYIEGDREALRKLHRLIRLREVLREMPRHKCPVDMVSVMRDFRRAEEERKRFSFDRVFLGLVGRVAAVAAVLLVVFLALAGNPVEPGGKAPLVAFSPAPSSLSTQPGAMKVGSGSTLDIFDKRFSPSVDGSLSGIRVRAARKLNVSPLITVGLSDWGPGTARLRAALAKAGLTPLFLPGYGMPVYKIKVSSPQALRTLLSGLKAMKGASLTMDDDVESFLAGDSHGPCPAVVFLAVGFSPEE